MGVAVDEPAIPIEVALVFETMTCQAAEVARRPLGRPSPCVYFQDWGTYHSFTNLADEIPAPHLVETEVDYVGRAPLTPELLTGCRKAPIMAVGINPNLPGWWPDHRGALNPMFEDHRQYAHYFRYRGKNKLQLDPATYEALGGGADDTPDSTFELDVPVDHQGRRPVSADYAPQAMYEAYEALLTDAADALGWQSATLSVGEDLSYGNMIASPSAKWTTQPDASLPAMTVSQRDGIVTECFRTKRYFLRQLYQSLPKVILVFSQSTANAFIGEMAGQFTTGAPQPGETVVDLLRREVRLSYGTAPGGDVLDGRVVFAPHPTGDPTAFDAVRPLVVQQIVAEIETGSIVLNVATGHLTRSAGSCVFCTMLRIGPCDYEAELVGLAAAAEVGERQPLHLTTAADLRASLSMLAEADVSSTPVGDAWAHTDEP